MEKMKNANDFVATKAKNGKFYCGQTNTVRSENKKADEDGIHSWDLNLACTTTTGINCEPCMKLDVQQRNLPYAYYVNANGDVTEPKPCVHKLKKVGNFTEVIEWRPVVCHSTTCGHDPVYVCNQDKDGGRGECHYDNTCSACNGVADIVGLHRHSDPQIATTTYKYLWRK